jgi:hypothetical protein
MMALCRQSPVQTEIMRAAFTTVLGFIRIGYGHGMFVAAHARGRSKPAAPASCRLGSYK